MALATVIDTQRVCALDGCENPIEATADETRRYCCVPHRKIARRQRREHGAHRPTAPVWPGQRAEPVSPNQHTRSAVSARSRRAEPGPPYRRLVPEPRPRWFRRSASMPYAARGIRPRYAHRPVRLLPEWLRPTSRRGRRQIPLRAPQAHAYDTPPPLPDWLQPYSHVVPPAPTPAEAPTAVSAFVRTTCRGALTRPGQRVAAMKAAQLDRLAGHRATKRLHKAEEETLRRQAAAVLAGTPMPGLVEDVPGRKRGRRVVKLALPVDPHEVIRVAWLGQMREALFAALQSLSNNRLRSVLTTVGIIAGVASVIVLVAMGDGMTKGFNDQWSRFATQITITPITGPVATGKAPQHLTDNDLRALQDRQAAPDIDTLSPAVASHSVTLTGGGNKAGAELFGIEQNYLELANRHMVAGKWFTSEQMSTNAREAIVGPQVVNALWGPDTDPNSVIGQPLRVGHSTFQIQGVVKSDGQNDNVVMVPLGAARAYVVGNNAGKLDVIIAKSSSTATLKQAEAQIYQILYGQHHVRVDTDRDFNVTDFTSILQQQMQSIRFMSMFILAVAAISLFVGGVGVANIMLVAVTERTREIGIRKAIGAPRRAIMRQFLSEAVMLTTLGGLVGSVFGIGLCLLGASVIPKLWPPDPSSLTPTPVPLLSLNPVLIAFGVSVIIGLLAGGYPAYRAARLRPIEALRFE
ncbi:MAG TPA: ABC transporter permease [Kribbella sp.]